MSTAKGRVRAVAPWILICWKDPREKHENCVKLPYYEIKEARILFEKLATDGYDVWFFEAKALKHNGLDEADCNKLKNPLQSEGPISEFNTGGL